jgi:phospholipase/lecithinase/hemolysin
VKLVIRLLLIISLFGFGDFSMQAAYTSLYVFGDALSATADNPAPAPAQYYYGRRDCNGRVWVEVLSQRQGIVYDGSKNNSYYDHNSTKTLKDVKNFVAPQDVANDLFIVWVCNSDTFDAASASDNSSQWIAANKQSQTNHFQIITNLYAKGVRTLIMPNAVDISTIPAFNAGTLVSSEHAGCVDYYTRFSNTISQARAACPGMTIYAPDFYSLLNNTFTNAAYYGLTNFIVNGHPMDAVEADNYKDPNNHFYPQAATNGWGTNFIFWDYEDPTAEFHEVIADITQQIISPVQISRITVSADSNRLDVVNMPVGLNGFVDNGTNLSPNLGPITWTAVQNITSTSATQSIFVPRPPPPKSQVVVSQDGDGLPYPGGTVVCTDLQFYKLYFPYAWTWP